MSYKLVMQESMSGDLTFYEDQAREDFSFSIRIKFSPFPMLGRAMEFQGSANCNGDEVPVEGEFTMFASGPQYDLEVDHPERGHLRIAGKKSYGKNGLKNSLITCPVNVYRDGKEIGEGEIVYRDPMSTFVIDALRVMKEEDVFSFQS